MNGAGAPEIRRRHLIVVATGHHDDSETWPDLDVEREVAVWRGWLTDNGLTVRRFEPLAAELAHDPSMADFDAFRDQAAESIRPTDAVVVLMTGHGEVIDRRHLLVLKAGDRRQWYRTMRETAQVISYLRGTGVEHALVVVDTCHSGQVGQAVLDFDEELPSGWIGVATAAATGTVRLGAVAGAVEEFLNQLRANDKYGSDLEEYLNPQDLINAMANVCRLHILFAYPSHTRSPCLPNPKYRDESVPATAPLNTRYSLRGATALGMLDAWCTGLGVQLDADADDPPAERLAARHRALRRRLTRGPVPPLVLDDLDAAVDPQEILAAGLVPLFQGWSPPPVRCAIAVQDADLRRRVADQLPPGVLDLDATNGPEAAKDREETDGLVDALSKELDAVYPDSSDRARAVAILTAAALSFGRGLAWRDVWPSVAGAVGDAADVTDQDIEDLRRLPLGRHLARGLAEDGSTVYRIGSNAVRDGLLQLDADGRPWPGADAGQRRRRLQGRVTQSLRSQLRRHTLLGEPIPPDPYVRRHLPEHAAAAGLLAALLSDPDIERWCDPDRLSVVRAREVQVAVRPTPDPPASGPSAPPPPAPPDPRPRAGRPRRSVPGVAALSAATVVVLLVVLVVVFRPGASAPAPTGNSGPAISTGSTATRTVTATATQTRTGSPAPTTVVDVVSVAGGVGVSPETETVIETVTETETATATSYLTITTDGLTCGPNGDVEPCSAPGTVFVTVPVTVPVTVTDTVSVSVPAGPG